MKMKVKEGHRIGAILLAILIVLSSLPMLVVSAADDQNIIFADQINAIAGSEVLVSIKISGNTGLAGFGINVKYDDTLLTPLSVTAGDIISNGMLNDSIETSTDNSFDVIWSGSSDFSDNGELFVIKFNVSSQAIGTTELVLDYSVDNTFDENIDEVVLNCKTIKIDISNEELDSFSQIALSATDAVPGEEVTLTAKLINHNGLSSATICFEFDDSVYNFETLGAYTGVDLNSITTQDGKIFFELSEIDSSVENQSLFTISFKILETAVEGESKFSASATNIIGAEGVHFFNCTSKVLPSDKNETILIKSTKIRAGEFGKQLMVPIYINNNYGLMGFKLTFTYDETILSPVSVSDTGLLQGSINNNIGTYEGRFDVLWNSTQNVAKNGEIFKLNFEVLSQESEDTDIVITYSQADTFNEKYEDVLFDCKNVLVKLNQECEHSFVEYTRNNDATCQKNETETSICEYGCGKKNTREIDNSKVDHKYTNYVYNNDATYFADGTQDAVCDYKCGSRITVIKYGSKLVDDIAPVLIIGVSNYVFKGYSSTDDYNIFINKNHTITFDAIDEETGLKSMSYFVSDVAMTQSEAEKITNWLNGSSYKFTEDGKYYIYAKAVDNSGNEKYVRTSGIVVDSSSPVISGIEDGKSYCSEISFTVTDSNLYKVLVNNKEVTEYILAPAIDGAFYSVSAIDGSGNKTQISVTVYSGHKHTNYISNNDATCENDGTETAQCDNGCGKTDTRTEEGSKLGHKFTNYASNNDATCENDGTETAHCENGCGKTDIRTDIASKIPHKFTEYVSNDDATHTSDGTKTAYCDYGCGTKDTITDEGTKLKYTVIWKFDDESSITTNVAHQENPVFTGLTPTKADEELYRYDFIGWSKDGYYGQVIDIENEEITSDTVYYAVFAKAIKNTSYYISCYEQDSDEVINGETIGLLGDVDGSGEINIMDVTLIQRYVAQLSELGEHQLVLADTNYSTDVNIFDATLIQRWLAKYNVSGLINHYVYIL